MESLSENIWDVVISGTGLHQALLAIALSRSGKKILHVDRNEYYGSDDAGFSVQEAEEWVQRVHDGQATRFKDATVDRNPGNAAAQAPHQLGPSRAYTLSLAPQIIYARSSLLPALVSSRVHTQLEFQAVGSWWVYQNGKLQRIPSGREDVFADDALSMRDKRALMKFLRYVLQESEGEETASAADGGDNLKAMLTDQFNLPQTLHDAILALSLSPWACDSARVDLALPKIKRHMRSLGAFGPGFGAVISKYGSNAEIAQVGCRAGAVGGAVYVLGQGVSAISAEIGGQETPDGEKVVELTLFNGEVVRARHVVSGISDLPKDWATASFVQDSNEVVETAHQISIVSGQLPHLFPATSENGPVPAGAIVLADPDDAANALENKSPVSPVYLQVHSEDTGECPVGQCVIYGSTLLDNGGSPSRLYDAVEQLLKTSVSEPEAKILWSLAYISRSRPIDKRSPTPFMLDDSGVVMIFPERSADLAFDDDILDSVKAVWQKILGDEAEDVLFMRFEEREGVGDED